MAERLEAFSPTIGIAPDEPPETLLLDIAGAAACFGGEAALVAQLLADCARWKLTVRAAVADTIAAAWALAHYGQANDDDALASDDQHSQHRKPNDHNDIVFIDVAAEEMTAALAALPLAALRLPPRTLSLLEPLGLRRIGDVAALPRASLVSRFGEELPRQLDRLFGHADEVLDTRPPAAEFAAHRLLDYPSHRRDAVEAVLQALLADVSAQLARRHCGALAVTCRLTLEAAPAVEFSFGLFSPTADERHLWQLVALQLERIRLTAAVTAASVSVTSAAPLENRQRMLFDEDAPRDDSRPLSALVERLTTRLGRAAVVEARQVPDAQPEYAVRYEPLVGQRRRRLAAGQRKRKVAHGAVDRAGDISSAASSSGIGRLGRPLRLVAPPALLEVLSIVPDGPPLRFRYRGEDHDVARFWGPERIETGWWRHRPVWRDYYRVETSSGAWFWLYRRRDDGRWRLHGEFG